MRTLLVLAIVAVLATPVFAGDGSCGEGCPLRGACAEGACDIDGFDCRNACPLAKQANTRRALGDEAVTVSAICRKDIADHVARNLQRI